MTLVTWFATFCWTIHISQWTIRWVLRRLTTHQLRYESDDLVDKHSDDLPKSSERNRSYGLHQTGLHPTRYNEVEDDVATAARMQIVRLENRMDGEIRALETENSKLHPKNKRERINHFESHIDGFCDGMSATENSKLETEKMHLRINEFHDRMDHFCEEMTALKKENSKLLSTVTAMIKYKQVLNKRIDLLHEYVTISSDQVASLTDIFKIFENRMNTFENHSVNVKCVQAQNEKIDLLHKYTIASNDRVTSLIDKYETLKNRIDTGEIESVNTTCMQSVNKRIDLLYFTQSANTKCEQALSEKIGLLHKYTKTSEDWLTSLTNKFVTLENRIDTVESQSVKVLQSLDKRSDWIQQHATTTSDQMTMIENKRANYNRCNRSTYWANNNETMENRMEYFRNNFEFTPVVSSSHLVGLYDDDPGMFSVVDPVLSKNDEFSLKNISSSERISNNLLNVEKMGIALSSLSIDSLGMLCIDGIRISPSTHPELFDDKKPEMDDNLRSLKQEASEHILRFQEIVRRQQT